MYEWDLTNTQASYAHSSLIFGMMVGAIFWGFFSDVKGRKPTFNITLFVTAAFGIASAFAPNFVVLCVLMFFLELVLVGIYLLMELFFWSLFLNPDRIS